MKKIIILGLCVSIIVGCLFSFSLIANAEESVLESMLVTTENGKWKISGNTYPDIAVTTLANEEDGDIAYVNQIKSADNGYYEFKIPLSLTNAYAFHIGCEYTDQSIYKIENCQNIFVKDLTIAKGDSSDVNGMITEGTTITASAELMNCSTESRKATIVLGLYDNGVLKNVKLQESELFDSNQKTTVSTAYTTTSNMENYSFKAFVFNDLSSLKPLRKSIEKSNKKAIKILAIGNSISEDAAAYLPYIAAADNVNLTIGRLYLPGCTLQQHWSNASSDAKAYGYNKTGCRVTTASIKDALESDEWDYITMHQMDSLSMDINNFEPALTNLSNYVKQYRPNAEQVMYQIWASPAGSARLASFGYTDPNKMFADMKVAYNQAAAHLGVKVLPAGDAFQRVLTLLPNAKLYLDELHASRPMGRYIAAAVWYEAFTGNSILENTYAPSGITAEDLNVLKQCVHAAVADAEYGWWK